MSDGVPERVAGVGRRDLPGMRLQLGEGLLDGMKSGLYGREETQDGTGSRDGLAHDRALMVVEVVHDDDIDRARKTGTSICRA